MGTHFYNAAMKMMANQQLDLDSDDIRVMLLTTDDPAAEGVQKSRASISAIVSAGAVEADAVSGYVRKSLASLSLTIDEDNDTVDWGADDITWSGLGADEVLNAAIVYQHNGADDAANYPICHCGGGFPKTCNGEDLHLRWDGSVGGTGGTVAKLIHPS